jgi:Uma2 family endonuclease
VTPQMPLFRPPPSSRDLITGDGEPLESARHRQQMEVLIQSLEVAWEHRTDFYAGGDMFLYYSETQSRRNDFRGPDVFVVLGTNRRERRAWVVWEEDGKAPDVVFELLSPSTEHIDRNDKMRLYSKVLKVGEYFLFDPWTSVLEGYWLDSPRGTYVRKEHDAKGRVYCEQVGQWLGVATSVLYGVEVPWLRWMDEDGRVLPVPAELAAEALKDLKAAEEHARAAEEHARAAEERARVAEEELRALRAKLGE